MWQVLAPGAVASPALLHPVPPHALYMTVPKAGHQMGSEEAPPLNPGHHGKKGSNQEHPGMRGISAVIPGWEVLRILDHGVASLGKTFVLPSSSEVGPMSTKLPMNSLVHSNNNSYACSQAELGPPRDWGWGASVLPSWLLCTQLPLQGLPGLRASGLSPGK